MNRDDLLNMLDLAGTDALPAEEPLDIKAADGKKPKVANPTVFELDDWALRRGQELLSENDRIRACELTEHALADFHAAAFEPDPRLGSPCADELRQEFLEQLLETPDYQALHASTMLNSLASELAAGAFAEEFSALKRAADRHKDETDAEMGTLRAVGRALDAATKDVDEAREAAAALGMGPGMPGSNDPAAIAALYRRVRSSPSLRRICELAGRFRRVAQSRQRLKASHGYDDLVGVVMDGDVGRLLPYELAKLGVPAFKLDTLRRLVERQAMCREYRATERFGKGPIIVSVDESGSMEGDKAHTAKALALAMAWIARHQRRWCGLVAYSGDSGERLLSLPPARWNEAALMDWLAAFIGCGSSLDVPVREMPDYYRRLGAPAGQTDVIFVTDAQCKIPAEVRDRFLTWKRVAKARLITLVIDNPPGDLAKISDEAYPLPALAAEQAGVERVLSL